jgi:hypothetical protein
MAPGADFIGIRLTFDPERLGESRARDLLDRFQALLERLPAESEANVGSLLDHLASLDAVARERVEARQQNRLRDLRRGHRSSVS